MAVIGVDFGGTKIDVGLVSRSKVLQLESDLTHSKASSKEVMGQIVSLIEKVLQKKGRFKVTAIGVGVPGVVDANGSVAELVNLPRWKNVSVKKILEKRFRLPVFVENDANCFALSEFCFGKAKKSSSLVGLTLGTGLGAGIVLNGKLFHGSNGNAGEFAHVFYLNSDFENYCSGKFFEREYGMSGVELYALAKKGNAKAKRAFSQFGEHLGYFLQMVVYSFDPQVIVLGGSISQAYSFFEKSMKKTLKKRLFSAAYSSLRIEKSSLKKSAVLGAGALCQLNGFK